MRINSSFDIASPSARNVWLEQVSQSIDFTVNFPGSVLVEFSDDGGLSYTPLGVHDIPAYSDDQSFAWIPSGTPSKNCRIKISSIQYPDKVAISDFFEIA